MNSIILYVTLISLLLTYTNANVYITVHNHCSNGTNENYNNQEMQNNGIGVVINTCPSTSKNEENKNNQCTMKPRSDYTFYPGYGYYKFHQQPATWHSAKYICELEGGHLVVIKSQAEADLMVKMFASYPLANVKYSDHTLVGYHDLQVEGQFYTVTGIPLKDSGYMKWASGQPGGGINENCGSIYKNGLYSDFNCNITSTFICEYKSQ